MGIALVTGSGDRVAAMGRLLQDEGIDVLTASSLDELGRLNGQRIDYYVQLPMSVQPTGESCVARVHSFLRDGLLGRYLLVDRLLPALADGATVVLVSGHTPAGAAVPDDERSRLALLHVLAHATRAEVGERGVRVTVAAGSRSDAELVGYARSGSEDPTARLSTEPAGRVTDTQYQDWRTELMGMRTAVG
jgi:NAD(P)-dependent dehydrogenase (short-subunit alcohol dehydrogenase family)